VQVEGSVFYIDWKDIQQPLPLGCRVSPTTNIGSAVSKGFDLQLRLQPLDGLSLTGAVAYTSAKFNETARTPTAVLVNDGDPLAIPPWTVTVSAEQSFLALGGEAFARGDLRYQSSYHGTPPAGTVLYQAADYRRPGVTEASVRVGVNWDKFGMSLFVNNLFNSTDLTARVLKGPAIEAAILRPRTMGITLTSRF
jgi:outer membrane receptor protein involved in Fe transport